MKTLTQTLLGIKLMNRIATRQGTSNFLKTAVYGIFAVALILVSGVTLVTCGGGSSSAPAGGNDGAGATTINLGWPAGYSYDSATRALVGPSGAASSSVPAYVTRVTLTITGANMSALVLDVPLDTLTVSYAVSPGMRTLTVLVETNIPGLSFTASRTAYLPSGGISQMEFNLEINAPPDVTVTASAANINKRQSVTVTASATDMDPADVMSYSWNGAGGSVNGAGASISWSATRKGTYNVCVTVDDGHGGVVTKCVSITVANRPPVISSVTYDTATQNAACSASDPDGDPLTYIWTDGTGWTGTGATVGYTGANLTSLTCTVNDGDGGTVSMTYGGTAGTPPAPTCTGNFTVNTTADTVDNSIGDGICADAGGACSLRSAIQEANNAVTPQVICVPAGTYITQIAKAGAGEDFSANGDLDIRDNDLTIKGYGGTVTIDGGGASINERVFHIVNNINVTLDGLTIQNGYETASHGAGVFKGLGTLTVTNSTISGNTTTVGSGGGIFNNSGLLTVTNSTITNNSSQSFGAGIDNWGSLTVTNSTITNNSSGNGGGIYNWSGGTVTVTNSTISSNTATTTNGGGGIINWGSLTVTNSTISGNTATTSNGGGISSHSGNVTVSNSTISGNFATGGAGGGIFNSSGTLTVTNSTISGNSAASGGGIHNDSATLTVTNSTISSNTATANGGAGSGIYLLFWTVTLKNTIVANQTGGTDCYRFGVTMTTLNSLDSDGTCGVGALSNQNPLLDVLANNGGPTQTHALLAGSPAKDAGDNATCAAFTWDQRGTPYSRTSNGVCDIGAYECQGATCP